MERCSKELQDPHVYVDREFSSPIDEYYERLKSSTRFSNNFYICILPFYYFYNWDILFNVIRGI